MNLTPEQYQALRRGTLGLLRSVLGGRDVGMLRVQGQDGEVKFVVLAASGVMARAVARAVVEVLGDPPVTEQWEVPG